MNRVLASGLAFLLLLAAAFVIWRLTAADAAPAPAPEGAAAKAPAVPADAATGSAPDGATAAGAPATAPGAPSDREAVPASALADRSPALVGRVVAADGSPVAGATVYAAPGAAFANASGRLDFDTFDPADFDELDAFDPRATMRSLRAQLADRVEVRTDDDGRFRVRAKGDSRGVGVRVLARGHTLLDRRVERPTERDVDLGTLVLERGAIVTGRVVDPGGTPIAGALVARVHEMEARMLGGADVEMPEMTEIEALRGGEVATSDAAGRFELLHLAPGDAVLRARHPEHPTARTDTLALAAGAALADVLVTMQRGGEIRGVVVGLPAERPSVKVIAARVPRPQADPTGMASMFGGDVGEMLADMGMPLGERTAEVGADGRFVLRGLAREGYRVWLAREGAGLAGSTACSARLEASPGGTVELRYDAGASVTLTVVDATSGAPIERLWVRDALRGGGGLADMMAAMPRPGRQARYPGGVVTVADLRPKAKQTLELKVEATGYAPFERSGITLPPSGGVDLGTVKLERTPVLEVTVVDDRTGTPVAGVNVALTRGDRPELPGPFGALAARQAGGPQRAHTDASGRCTLNRFADGQGVVVAEAKGYARCVSEPLAFGAAGPDAFTARLRIGGTVTVRVENSLGEPVAAAPVEHREPGGNVAMPRPADAAGAVRYEQLAPGSHRFRLAASANPMERMMISVRVEGGEGGGDEDTWQVVEVADGGAHELRLVKQPRASLRGVVRENGAPLEGARVSFREGPVGGARDEAQQAVVDMMGAVGGGAASRSVKTDEQGVYALAELPEGEHRLQVTHRGRAMPASMVVTLRTGDNVLDVDLDLTTVRGVVRDPEGNPVDGARVRVRPAPAAAGEGEVSGTVESAIEGMMPGLNLGGGSTLRTDANGVYEARGVDPDVELIVQATAKGFAAASVRTTAPRGSTTTAPDVALAAAGRIKVTLAGEQTFAAASARWVGEGEAAPPVVQMLRRGTGTLDGLRPGLWEVRIDGPRSRGEADARTRRVEVVAGQTVDVNF